MTNVNTSLYTHTKVLYNNKFSMRDNQTFNMYVEELINTAVVEINKRDIKDLTESYLDDIFELSIERLRCKRHVDVPEHFNNMLDMIEYKGVQLIDNCVDKENGISFNDIISPQEYTDGVYYIGYTSLGGTTCNGVVCKYFVSRTNRTNIPNGLNNYKYIDLVNCDNENETTKDPETNEIVGYSKSKEDAIASFKKFIDNKEL